MKKFNPCLLFSFLLFFDCRAQLSLNLEWIKPVGGTLGHRGLRTMDRNDDKFLMAGYIAIADSSYGCGNLQKPALFDNNAWLLMTDTNGNKLWSKCYGGTNGDDQFFQAHFGKGNTIWADGSLTSTDGDFPNVNNPNRALIFKFDSVGNPFWYKFYGADSGDNGVTDFITTSDGGAIFLDDFNYANGDIPYKYNDDPFTTDTWLCKIDSNGVIQWSLVLGGSGNQGSIKVKELQPGRYTALLLTNSIDDMLLGLNFDSVDYSPWLVEVDTAGHILSSRVASNVVSPSDFQYTNDKGVLLAGLEEADSSGICTVSLCRFLRSED